MENSITLKIALLSAVYFIIAVILLLLVDVGVYYFIGNLMLPVINWFNKINIFFKILIILMGGMSVFIYFLQFTQKLSSLIGGLIFDRLPQNIFTIFSTLLISIGNSIFNIIWLWKIPNNYNFWIVLELIILSVFIWSLGAIVIPAKDQIKEYSK